jgi:hypothetical protein
MKNFLSAVYIKTNFVSDERLCVGLFCGSENGMYFSYSDEKLKLAASILPKDVVKSLNDDLKRIAIEIKEINTTAFSNKENTYSSAYFTYLSKYSSGLLQFTTPEPISNEINSGLFESFFLKYVGGLEEKPLKNKPTDFRKQVKKVLSKEAFKKHADINFELTTKLVPDIFAPSKVDFIACNGSIFAGKAVDFQAELPTIQSHINSFWITTEGLKNLAKNKKLDGEGTYELYINYPEDKDHKKLVDSIKRNPIIPFSVKDIDSLVESEATILKYEKFTERMANI